MKYGIIKDNRVTEVTLIPDPLPSWAADPLSFLSKMFPAFSGWEQVSETCVNGSVLQENGNYINPVVGNSTSPILLSRTGFQDLCVSCLGAGVTGMSRFSNIMDATKAHENGAVRFAYERYNSALTFEKTNAETLLSILYTFEVITEKELTDILAGWPEA